MGKRYESSYRSLDDFSVGERSLWQSARQMEPAAATFAKVQFAFIRDRREISSTGGGNMSAMCWNGVPVAYFDAVGATLKRSNQDKVSGVLEMSGNELSFAIPRLVIPLHQHEINRTRFEISLSSSDIGRSV